MRLSSLYRYPVKGLSPERLPDTRLEAGGYFPGDRLYAIENGPSGFDAEKPEHQPKIKYLMLMRDEALARLRCRYDDKTRTLRIAHDGGEIEGDLSSAEGREKVESFFAALLPGSLRGAPRMLAAPNGYRFTDSRRGFVSLINLASVAAIETLVGAAVDPLRFRGNLYLDGLKPWEEFGWINKTVSIGAARLKISKRIERCAATNVDPVTGARDLSIPNALLRALGHADCGVYAEVIAGGLVRPGDALAPEGG